MDALELIKSRRSVRKYSEKPLEQELINKILKAAIWAPSGKNGQPWKFKVITDKSTICQISNLSVYGSWMRKAAYFICVFLDNEKTYNYIKDVQSCGAVIQNIMLYAHSLNIGSCWVGEILSNADKVKSVLQIEQCNCELMGIVTLGYALDEPVNIGRRSVESFLL